MTASPAVSGGLRRFVPGAITRNQRASTTGDTPADTAASSLDSPPAMSSQNRRRSSRHAIGGRPGEINRVRPDLSDRRLRTPVATSISMAL